MPGILFLEIDGLAEPILRQALAGGWMPTVARWVSSGSHTITGWEPDLSSQTSASQAGILLGDNTDIPAYRWYDKGEGKLMVSSSMGTARDARAAPLPRDRTAAWRRESLECLLGRRGRQRLHLQHLRRPLPTRLGQLPRLFRQPLHLAAGDRALFRRRDPRVVAGGVAGRPQCPAANPSRIPLRVHPRRHHDPDAGSGAVHAAFRRLPGRAGRLRDALRLRRGRPSLRDRPAGCLQGTGDARPHLRDPRTGGCLRAAAISPRSPLRSRPEHGPDLPPAIRSDPRRARHRAGRAGRPNHDRPPRDRGLGQPQRRDQRSPPRRRRPANGQGRPPRARSEHHRTTKLRSDRTARHGRSISPARPKPAMWSCSPPATWA